MFQICRPEFGVYPRLGAADLPLNVGSWIAPENMMCHKSFYRSGTVLFQHGDTEAVEAWLQIEALIYRNHLRSFSAVARVSEFQFFTWRRWPRRSTIILE